MGRIHLFEFEDQAWFPAFLRNYMTDFLQYLTNASKLFKGILPMLLELVKSSETKRIIDLGSGGGGGMLWLSEALRAEEPNLEIVLTDLYPNIAAFKYTSSKSSAIRFETRSVNALDVPEDLIGIRTQFLSLHHFKQEQAVRIIENAISQKQRLAIFEGQERSLPSILAMLFSPISVLLITPLIRPFKWGRLLFTYIIPLVPLFVLWDGVVSALRTYSVSEMNQLLEKAEGGEQYTWQVGKVKSGPGVNLYMIGSPKAQ